jgi:predicted glutamine amidotransferase
MCVIVISEEGKKIGKREFKNMWERNDHGFGVAYYDEKDGLIYVKKGIMNEKEAWKYYEAIPQMPHIIHFRLASAGSRTPQLCHPFRVDLVDTQELEYKACAVLFHNGTVSDYKNLIPVIIASLEPKEREKFFNVEDISDTYLMSIMVRLFSHKVLKFYAASRWAIFTIESGSPQIIIYGDFKKYKDFYVSNLSWQIQLQHQPQHHHWFWEYNQPISKKNWRTRYYEDHNEDEDEDEELRNFGEEERDKEFEYYIKKYYY